ncbi:MAG TPA: DUF1684 domain-containing protein [Thermoanaerobaculia bacterium]
MPGSGRAVPLSLLVFALSAFTGACAPEKPAPAPPAQAPEGWAEEVRAWQEERAASLQEPGDWLSMVGLHWLDEEGESTVGSAPENDLVFAAPAPPRAGTFHREGDAVRVEAAPGVELRRAVGASDEGLDFTVTGDPVPELTLAPDTSGDPTVVALGSLRFWLIERGDRLGARVLDLESPALAAFEGLEYFPVDPVWRVEGRLERAEDLTVMVPNVLGQVSEEPTPGPVVFRLPGADEEHRLLPTVAGDGELFLVFGDGTNGHETYGGGRFLYADPPGPDGRVILDFNRAYNPPCAFTPYATCPLPPKENELPVRIEAGEKAYAGAVPH